MHPELLKAPVREPVLPVRPPSLAAALSMCRAANLEVTLPTPMCWDLALYIAQLEAVLGVTEGINGLTEAETSATASVFGLSSGGASLPEPTKAQLAKWALDAIEAGPNAAVLMNLEGIKDHLRSAAAGAWEAR